MNLQDALSKLRQASSSATPIRLHNTEDCRNSRGRTEVKEFDNGTVFNGTISGQEHVFAVNDDLFASNFGIDEFKDEEYSDNFLECVSEVTWSSINQEQETRVDVQAGEQRMNVGQTLQMNEDSEVVVSSLKGSHTPDEEKGDLLSGLDGGELLSGLDGGELLSGLDMLDDSLEDVLWNEAGTISDKFSTDGCNNEFKSKMPPQKEVEAVSSINPLCGSKRRFPGPAGILPKLVGSRVDLDKERSTVNRPPLTPCIHPQQNKRHQNYKSDVCFSSEPWEKMEQDLNLMRGLLLTSECAMYVQPVICVCVLDQLKRLVPQVTKKKLTGGRVPHLRVLIKMVRLSGKNASVQLKDPTGEIKGTVHADVLEEYGSSITSGSVMVLRRVSVLSPTPRRHYLSITLCNVVSLYTPSGVQLRGCDILSNLLADEASELEDKTGSNLHWRSGTVNGVHQ